MTVNQRAKATGLVMGPNHPRARQFAQQQAPSPNAENGRTNYRKADGEESCGNCSAYEDSGQMGEGQCRKYSLSCRADHVCDGHMEGGGGEGMVEGAEGGEE